MRGGSVAGVLTGLLFLVILLAAALPGTVALPAIGPQVTGVGIALWEGRTPEVILQGLIILAGSAGVLLYLGTRAPKEGSP